MTTGNNPCLLKDEWANKLIRNYYYSAVKRNELLLHTTCVFLWGITLNEKKKKRKQKQKQKNQAGCGGSFPGLGSLSRKAKCTWCHGLHGEWSLRSSWVI